MDKLSAFMAVAVLLIGCSGVAATETTPTTAEPPTTASPTSQPATTTTTFPADAAPPELQGTWRTEIASDDIVFLTLTVVGYGVNRGSNSASGETSIDGDEIRFFNGNICADEGVYSWAREGDSLTFTLTDEGDPCGGRRPILDGITYSLVSGGG